MSKHRPAAVLRSRLRSLLAPRPTGSAQVRTATGGPRRLLSTEDDLRIRTEGWTVVDLLESDECAILLRVWRDHHAEVASTWESDFYSKDPATKRNIHEIISTMFGPALEAHVRDPEVLLGAFVTNWPGPDGGLTLHHHSTIVPAEESGSLVVWCALTEATEANGTLHVVPRSHLLQDGVRPERTRSWHEDHTARLLSSHLVSVPLEAGQALVFDNQLLHCSFANETTEPRVAVASLVVPRDATPRYHELGTDGRVSAYLLDSSFFIDNDPGALEWARPEGLELLASGPWTPTTVSVDQLEATLVSGTCAHGDAEPERAGHPGTEPPRTGAPEIELSAAGSTTTGHRAAAVVADPHRQQELEEFGFTVLPRLDPTALGVARAASASTGPAPDDPRRALNWSFHSHDEDHKHRVSRALRDGVWPTIEHRFADQTPFLSTFITKWPGPDSGFAPHQDPTLVDERTSVGVTVWIPLHDVDLDNGMLWVVPGSHRIPGGFRVPDVDQFPFADCEREILDDHGVGIPLAAGEILVFDNRIIHFSLPNVSRSPRVVASFGLRPTDGPSTLARPSGDTVEVHALPEDFFIDVEPSEQHLWEPTRPPLFTAPLDRRRWEPSEFARLCRTLPPPPRGVRPSSDQPGWVEPTAFCALCGSDRGLAAEDRRGRNNAQLICPSCRGEEHADATTA